MTPSFEQSFKKRLQIIAKERNLVPAALWQNVLAERFLVRLSTSPYCSHFVLKGGVLLAKHVKLDRETQDLDFAVARLSHEVSALRQVFDEITAIDANDGFIFSNPIIAPLEHFHMKYTGAQIKIKVQFGKAKFPLFIDLGFGDLIKVHEQNVQLLSHSKGPLFEPFVTLNCYPLAFVFAEKLETVLYRGAENSRMKDFHDLHIVFSRKMLFFSLTSPFNPCEGEIAPFAFKVFTDKKGFSYPPTSVDG